MLLDKAHLFANSFVFSVPFHCSKPIGPVGFT